jgi:hypothetical protein
LSRNYLLLEMKRVGGIEGHYMKTDIGAGNSIYWKIKLDRPLKGQETTENDLTCLLSEISICTLMKIKE